MGMEKMIGNKTNKNTQLVTGSLSKAFSYEEYRELVAQHVANGTSTGPQQTEALTNYTLLNHARMKRLDKTTKVTEEIQENFKSFTGDHTWIVLTESWCGDAAQSMPAMNLLAHLAPSIEFKVLLRDENPELMDAFLTHGSRSIPKLIVLDNATQEVIANWGPRPSIATQMANDYKQEHGSLSPQFKEKLQGWYNKDRSVNIIEDLALLLR